MATISNFYNDRIYQLPLNNGLFCGDNYHHGKQFKFAFKNKKKIAEVLFLIQQLQLVNIKEIKCFSFIFYSDYIFKNKFIFKLCRYVRCDEMYKIIEITNEAIRQGVQPWNAFVLAHYYGDMKYKYSNGCDIININNISKGFNNYDEFIYRFQGTTAIINNIFPQNLNINKSKLQIYISKKQYLSAEKYILNEKK